MVAIYRLLLAGPLTRTQIVEALADLYGPNADRAVRRDLETLAGRPFAELTRLPEVETPHAAPVLYDRASGQVSLAIRDALLRLDQRDWAALDLLSRTFAEGAPHAKDVQALIERVRAVAEPARVSPFPVEVSLAPADAKPASGSLLERIERAMRQRQEVAFLYRSPGSGEGRSFDGVELRELAFRHGHCYLLVYEQNPGRLRELRVDRIVAESWRMLPRVVAESRQPRGTMIQYRLSAKLASGGVSERLCDQRVEWEPDGSAVVTGEARDLFWAARLILGYGAHAEALMPPELRAMVAEEARRMATLYETSDARKQ